MSTEPSAYSSRIWAMSFCGPKVPLNLVKRPGSLNTLYIPFPSSNPTAFWPRFKSEVMSRTSYRQVLSYLDQPGDRKSSPTFLPFSDISYWPRPQTTARARVRPALTANSRRSRIDGRFVSVAPIHFARHSSGRSKPMVQSACLLHADTSPLASHTRTFQKTCCKDFNPRP